MVDAVAESLTTHGLSRCDRRELYRYLQFRRCYPQIVESACPLLADGFRPQSLPNAESATPQWLVPGERLLKALSFSHFAELIEIDDPLKRSFYETECIRGGWSVRALKRQVGSLFFERSALSTDTERVAPSVHAAAERADPTLAIRDPNVFQFLGLRSQDDVSESDLEQAPLDNLHDFLLELGHGFASKRARRAS